MPAFQPITDKLLITAIRRASERVAQHRIALDLNDGVKANNLKFPGLLAKIPGFDKKDED